MRKKDILFHSDGCGRPGRPAVCVKIRGSGVAVQARGWRTFKALNPDAPARFSQTWLEENVCQDTQDFFWNDACEQGFDLAQSAATEIFGPGVKVWSEGRSSGWAIVEGLGPVDTWPGGLCAKWGKWARLCAEYVQQVPGAYLDAIYHNVFLPEEAARDKEQQTEAASI